MLIQLTEEQKMLRDMAREFTKNEIEAQRQVDGRQRI